MFKFCEGQYPCAEGLFHDFLLSLHMAVDSFFCLYTEPSVLKVPYDLIICYAWMMCTYLAVFDSCDMNQSTKTPLSPFSNMGVLNVQMYMNMYMT